MLIGPVTVVRLTPEIDPSLLNAIEVAIPRQITIEVIAADKDAPPWLIASVPDAKLSIGSGTGPQIGVE